MFYLWRFTEIYAIIETGGKQYKVAPGRSIKVERLAAAEGDTVELDKVLLIADEDQQIVGKPTIEGAKVVATVESQGKDKKIIVFNYKNKTRSSKKTGHRQMYTALSINEIVKAGVS